MRTQESPRRRSRTRPTRLRRPMVRPAGRGPAGARGPGVGGDLDRRASPNLTQFDNVLWGVDSLSSTSAWAVGRADTGTLPIRRPVIERWNGAAWSISASPLPSGGGELRDVDATSASNAWAVGSHNVPGSWAFSTLTMRWNGQAWSVVPSPTANDGTLEGVVALASNDVWAVGQRGNPNVGVGRTFTLRTGSG